MSPRSAEFLEGARRRLQGARGALEQDPATALSAAYYAMLYAARAALSERDAYARTHAGTWHLFSQTFVAEELFDATLAEQAQRSQPQRERADYDAWIPTRDQAADAIALAASFLAAVERLIAELGSG